MTEEKIKETIFKILREIAPEADLDSLDPNDNMLEALDIDSFDFLNLIIGLNEELEIEIPEEDYGDVTLLSALIRYVAVRAS